jgi:large subunit ribosomal protein L18
MLKKTQNRIRRAQRVRSRITGTATKPRLSVYRSNTSISIQAIDDVAGVTIVAAHDMALRSGTKTERAIQVGTAIAESLLAKGIKECVFDRGGYLYHGRVKALADAARAGGLAF